MDKNSIEIKALIEKMETDRKNLFDERKVYIEQLEIEKNKKDYHSGTYDMKRDWYKSKETEWLEGVISKISSELNANIAETQMVKNELSIYEILSQENDRLRLFIEDLRRSREAQLKNYDSALTGSSKESEEKQKLVNIETELSQKIALFNRNKQMLENSDNYIKQLLSKYKINVQNNDKNVKVEEKDENTRNNSMDSEKQDTDGKVNFILKDTNGINQENVNRPHMQQEIKNNVVPVKQNPIVSSKQKYTVPAIESKKDKVFAIESKKDRVYFNLRTGKYEYVVGNDIEKSDIKVSGDLLKGKGIKEIRNLIIDEYPEIKDRVGDIDLNLYYALRDYDNKYGAKKTKDYITAVLTGEKELMPVELVYDIRSKNDSGDKEKQSKEDRISFWDKMKMKQIANKHEKMDIAIVRRDPGLWKKVLIGLGLGIGAAAIGTALPQGQDKPKEPTNVAYEEPAKEGAEVEKPAKEVVPEKENEVKEDNKIEDVDYVSVKGGLVYTYASDARPGETKYTFLDGSIREGSFVEDMDCKIANRAICEIGEDGTEKTIITSNGKKWNETGIDLSQYENPKYVEKYALEAIDGRTDSRGYSIFGWVKATDCEKIYEKSVNINGKEYTAYNVEQNLDKSDMDDREM